MERPAHGSSSLPSNNPPSIEAAYKRKSIALKKRLTEIEEENEIMRLRNQRGWHFIQKMRLETCILLERLATVTGMMGAELPQNAGDSVAVNGGFGAAGHGVKRFLDDETEGSSDEQPRTV